MTSHGTPGALTEQTSVKSRPRTFLLRAALCCAAALALAGCNKTDDLGPPDIHFGQDTCHACGMIIEDDRYAAAAVFLTPAGDVERHAFDDAGEMLEFQPPPAPPASAATSTT